MKSAAHQAPIAQSPYRTTTVQPMNYPPPPYGKQQTRTSEASPAVNFTSPIASPIPGGYSFPPQVPPPLMASDVGIVIRLQFLRKVYSLLSLMLLITVAVSLCLCLIPGVAAEVAKRTWIVFPLLAGSLILVCVVIGLRNSYPANLILLFLFALVESGLVGVICAAYYDSGQGVAVLIAFGVTFGVFLGLTLFTMQSRVDWSFLKTGLYALVWLLIVWGIIVWIIGFHTGYLFSLLGAVLFCGFIVYDTNNICKKFSPDEYIGAALTLYIDVITCKMIA